MPLNFLNTGYFADKVGIGTDSPGESLEILKDGGAIIKLHDPGTNSWKIKADANFHIYDDSSSDYLTILNNFVNKPWTILFAYSLQSFKCICYKTLGAHIAKIAIFIHR